jgi:GTPase SAR1 family protein
MNDLADRLRGLCAEAADRLPPDHALAAADLAARLDGPLRIAIAGRVKAGKSTLLNALVGERLAPTDAGECTRTVTWYRRGDSYEVAALLHDGTKRPLPFRRSENSLEFDLDGTDLDSIERIDVVWPSARLGEITLIDTPGLASLDDHNSSRSIEFLTPDDAERSTDADAVLYLMRHIHRRDIEFLDAFMDRTVTQASPANAVGILSRADEIGGGRLDALQSAGRIATRYQEDPIIKSLCGTVVPVAGLLAEAGEALRQEEFADLALLAGEDDSTLGTLLVTSDRFQMAGVGPLTIEKRKALLKRFGLFGVRFAVDRIRSQAASDAPGLARDLVAASGVDDLRRILVEHLLPRARTLQGRAVLAGLRGLAGRIDGDEAAWLRDEIERIEMTAWEFSELRLLHLAVAGVVGFDDAEVGEVRRLLLTDDPAIRLGLPEAKREVLSGAALQGVERWRHRAADPRNDPTTVEACQLAAQVYERLYGLIGNGG